MVTVWDLYLPHKGTWAMNSQIGWPTFNLPQIVDVIERYRVWMFKWVNFILKSIKVFFWQWFLLQFIYLWKSFVNLVSLLYYFLVTWIPEKYYERMGFSTEWWKSLWSIYDWFGYGVLSLVQLWWNLPSFYINKVNECLMNSSGYFSLAIILSLLSWCF